MVTVNHTYIANLQKEADFWGKMAEERAKGGIPLTMDFQLATRYRVSREAIGWGDYLQDPWLESLTPFGMERERFFAFIRNHKGKNALDLCCGAGFLSLELARSGKDVDAIDLSEREINVAKRYQSQLKHRPKGKINWIVADLNTHRLKENTYDIITAWDGLHHIPDIDMLMSQIGKSLKPGGVFLFSERVWGGSKQSFKTKISQGLEVTTNVMLPLAWSYRERWNSFTSMVKTFFTRYVLRKDIEVSIQDSQHEEFESPFEDATGWEMMESIRKHFKVEKLKNYGAFTEEACRSLNLPRFLRIPSILFLSWFDYLFVKSKILDGKIVVAYAKKR